MGRKVWAGMYVYVYVFLCMCVELVVFRDFFSCMMCVCVCKALYVSVCVCTSCALYVCIYNSSRLKITPTNNP